MRAKKLVRAMDNLSVVIYVLRDNYIINKAADINQ